MEGRNSNQIALELFDRLRTERHPVYEQLREVFMQIMLENPLREGNRRKKVHIAVTPDAFMQYEAGKVVEARGGKIIDLDEFAKAMKERMEYVREKGLNEQGYIKE